MNNEKQKKWQWNTPWDKVRVAGGSLSGMAVLGLGISQMFTPVGWLIAGIAFAGSCGIILSKTLEADDKLMAQQNKSRLSPLNPIWKIAADIASKMKFDKMPKIFVDQGSTAKIARAQAVSKSYGESVKKDLEFSFAAAPGLNTLEMSEAAVNARHSERTLKHVLAHEMAHLKVDKKSLEALGRMTMMFCTGALIIAAVAVPFFGAASILAAGITPLKMLGGLWATRFTAKIFFNYASRVKEKRADRNAIYITRDFNSAAANVASFTSAPPSYRRPWITEIFRTHPSSIRRIEALKKSWNKAITYPPLSPGDKMNDNNPQEPAFLKNIKLRT